MVSSSSSSCYSREDHSNEIKVATFNIRNTNDRYEKERKPFLKRTVDRIKADIFGFQEMEHQSHQHRTLAKAIEGKSYDVFNAKEPRHHIESYSSSSSSSSSTPCGPSLFISQNRKIEVLKYEKMDLSRKCVVQRALIKINDVILWVVNTHLYSPPSAHDERLTQVTAIRRWMEEAKDKTHAIVLMGDFNATPKEKCILSLKKHGYISTYSKFNKKEPKITWPSGIQASTMDTDGVPSCFDYIFVKSLSKKFEYQVVASALAANKPSKRDKTLYPSDHYAIVTTLKLSLTG